MKKISLLTLVLIFCLSFATTVFAAEDQPEYPRLGTNYFALGQNSLYVIDIDTNQEYAYTLKDGTHVIEAVISLSLTDAGREKFLGKEQYKDNGQWIIQRITFEFRPDKTGYFTRHRYQILDGDKNVLAENLKPSQPMRWEQGSDLEWWNKLIVHFMQYQLKNGAYVDKTGKLCYN